MKYYILGILLFVVACSPITTEPAEQVEVPNNDSEELPNNDSEEQQQLCCQAMTASCLACQEDTSVEEYCSENPTVQGCESVEQGEYYKGTKTDVGVIEIGDLSCNREERSLTFSLNNPSEETSFYLGRQPLTLPENQQFAAVFVNEYQVNTGPQFREGERLFGNESFPAMCNDITLLLPGKSTQCQLEPVFLRPNSTLETPNEIVVELPGTQYDDRIFFNCV